MKKIEQLIKTFKELKESLEKMDGSPTVNTQVGAGLAQPASSATTSLANAFGGAPASSSGSSVNTTAKAEGSHPTWPGKVNQGHPDPRSNDQHPKWPGKQAPATHIDGVPKKPRSDGGNQSPPAQPLIQSEICKFDKNGQWSLEKAISRADLPEDHEGFDQHIASKINAPHPVTGQRHVMPIPAAAAEVPERPVDRTKTMDVSSVNKVDPEENVNIPHPKGKAKYAKDSIKRCKSCKGKPCKCS